MYKRRILIAQLSLVDMRLPSASSTDHGQLAVNPLALYQRAEMPMSILEPHLQTQAAAVLSLEATNAVL